MTKTITISPITRLEGHGKIDILLDDRGQVQDAYLQVVELRGFENFCVGRPVEELPRIMPKICGVCPGAHHMASAKACDAVYGVTIPGAAKKLRELYLCAHLAHSHLLHFFALAAPDFIPGSAAPKAERNLLGLIKTAGLDLGREVLRHRGYAQKIQGIIAGHPIHPVAALAGGMAKPITGEERGEIESMARSLARFAAQALDIFESKILVDPQNTDLFHDEAFALNTHYAGLVDEQGRVNFYDGTVRVVDPAGEQVAEFSADGYLDHLAEKVVPWSYLKLPYLKNVGWQGLTDGPASGVFRVNALARLNVADGMATPNAQSAYERFFVHFGHRPVHQTMAYHWARLIECLYAAERVVELAVDEEVLDTHVRTVPSNTPKEGVGVVEAPRGTLYHHYRTDARGIVTAVNLIVATAQNNAAINLSVKNTAKILIDGGEISDDLLNRVEMAFRAYDPCLACATHALPGKMALELTLYQHGKPLHRLRRDGT